MKRKNYEKPTMQVVKLQQQSHILAVSGVEGARNSYGIAVEDTWGYDEGEGQGGYGD